MDLEKAFGPQFKFTSNVIPLLQPERRGVENIPVTSPELTESANFQSSTPIAPVSPVIPITQVLPPDVYLLQIQIGREDTHLICLFLFVFIVSFLLSSRKN